MSQDLAEFLHSHPLLRANGHSWRLTRFAFPEPWTPSWRGWLRVPSHVVQTGEYSDRTHTDPKRSIENVPLALLERKATEALRFRNVFATAYALDVMVRIDDAGRGRAAWRMWVTSSLHRTPLEFFGDAAHHGCANSQALGVLVALLTLPDGLHRPQSPRVDVAGGAR